MAAVVPNLKEGTKTSSPVTLDKAQSIMDKLVASKTKKGYEIIDDDNDATDDPQTDDPKIKALLGRLTGKSQFKTKYDLNRLIWKLGELKVKEAVPFLVKMLKPGYSMKNNMYSSCSFRNWGFFRF